MLLGRRDPSVAGMAEQELRCHEVAAAGRPAALLDPHPERREPELGVAHEREQVREVGQAIGRQRRDLRSGPCVVARGDEGRPVPALCRGHRARL